MAKKEMKMNAMKMPIQSMYGKMNAMKTGDDDLTPMNNMKLNAMIKDPHKSKGDDPKKDMNATYMKSDVRGDVKNGDGTDMSKVNDKPKPMAAMKKSNAMYKTEKYLDEKPGSIQNVVAQMFQSEQRTFWEAPEIYFEMSPFMHAQKVNEPILLIHGEADNNSGTFPVQSKRYYHALKGHGATAKLVLLPHESHGYKARESVMHVLWETANWLDKYVKKDKKD